MNQEIANWLAKFEASPVESLHALVLGRTAVPAWSRSSLREIFVEIWQTHDKGLDDAVANWISSKIFQPPPERTPDEVWASHLQDVFRAVAGVPMPRVETLLRERSRDFRSWLRPFRYAENCDPEASFLAALAWSKTNKGLAGLWQSLALRKNHEPVYYTDVGLLGLCKMRDDPRKHLNYGNITVEVDEDMPSKPPFLLLATLIDLAETDISHEDWELTTRALLASYYLSAETWVREFNAVVETRLKAKRGLKWLKQMFPQVRIPKIKQKHSAYREIPLPHTIPERNAIIAEVKEYGPAKLGQRLQMFLSRHRTYAAASLDPHYINRTFDRLADEAKMHDPVWAVQRAEEAISWNDRNPHSWTILARCLRARGIYWRKKGDTRQANADFREALDVLWAARVRFPSNAVVLTELAKQHWQAGDYSTAETLFREAVAEFAEDPKCFTEFGEMLIRRSKQTDEILPDEVYSLFQHAAKLGDKYAKERLSILKRSSLKSMESQLFPSSDLKQPLKSDDSKESVEFAMPSISEMRPAQRLGNALLFQWQACRAKSDIQRESLFNEAQKLLDLPRASAGDCWMAFIEARGFLLLARNRVSEARAYFEEQLSLLQGHSLALRLGYAEARLQLGEDLDEDSEIEFGSYGLGQSILPLVLKILRLLQSVKTDEMLQKMLLDIYPRVRELAKMPPSELGDDSGIEARDSMMAHLLVVDVFRPAKIQAAKNIKGKNAISRLRVHFNMRRNELFSVVEKFALAA